jgi:hypothetical protein
MLGKILAAIGSAIRSALMFLGRVVTAPLRAFGGGGQVIPPVAPVSDPEDDAPMLPSSIDVDEYKRIAQLVLRWCSECVIADRQVPMPSALPRSTTEWLRGLERDEVIALAVSDRAAISLHFQESETITGVRPMQPLPAITWPPALPMANVSSSLLSAVDYADASELAAGVAHP